MIEASRSASDAWRVVRACGGRVLALVAILVLAGCGDAGEPGAQAPRPQALTVGFIYVGSIHDRGYNQAAHEGALAVRRQVPGTRVLETQHVPESRAAATAMEELIARGATIVFATSFGHLDAALEVAARHPTVTFLHQGGQQTAANLGTYFGSIWDAEYAAGQAAGLSTRSDRLGFVAAYPISQSLLTINAFALGARSVNPAARTRVLFTSSWCSPRKQRDSTRRLLRWGADVVAQHQDCTATVIRTAAAGGARVVGFHHDARSVAPKAWLTGARFRWDALFVDMVRTIRAGRFATSRYAGRLRLGLRDGAVGLSPFGDAATPAIRRTVRQTLTSLRDGTLRPFTGPVRDQAGRVRIRGPQPSVTDLEEIDYLVEGVTGDLR